MINFEILPYIQDFWPLMTMAFYILMHIPAYYQLELHEVSREELEIETLESGCDLCSSAHIWWFGRRLTTQCHDISLSPSLAEPSQTYRWLPNTKALSQVSSFIWYQGSIMQLIMIAANLCRTLLHRHHVQSQFITTCSADTVL